MRPTWKLPPGDLTMRLPERAVEHVLVEFDGPQLVTLRDADNRYLGVASDIEGETVRWIHAQITELEWQALVRGLVPLRDAFLKPVVWVIDEYADGIRVRGQMASGTDLDESDLPKAGALMPASVRRTFASEMPALPARMLRFQQKGTPPHTIDLTTLSRGSAAYQRLVTACATPANETAPAARSDLAKRSRLLAVARPMAASYGIELGSHDPALFDTVSSRIAKLIASADNREALMRFFAEFPDAQSAYNSFLRTLYDNDLDVMASWPSGGAFLSADRSVSVRTVVESTIETKEQTIHPTGYFRGFTKGSKKFEFFEPAHDRHYSGDVSKTLLSKGDAKVVISDADLHVATILSRRALSPSGDVTMEYELLDYAPVPPASGTPG